MFHSIIVFDPKIDKILTLRVIENYASIYNLIQATLDKVFVDFESVDKALFAIKPLNEIQKLEAGDHIISSDEKKHAILDFVSTSGDFTKSFVYTWINDGYNKFCDKIKFEDWYKCTDTSGLKVAVYESAIKGQSSHHIAIILSNQPKQKNLEKLWNDKTFAIYCRTRNLVLMNHKSLKRQNLK